MLAEIASLLSQHTISDHNRPTSEMPFEWRFTGGRIVACFYMLLGKPLGL